jgi:hypothetical protein
MGHQEVRKTHDPMVLLGTKLGSELSSHIGGPHQSVCCNRRTHRHHLSEGPLRNWVISTSHHWFSAKN